MGGNDHYLVIDREVAVLRISLASVILNNFSRLTDPSIYKLVK